MNSVLALIIAIISFLSVVYMFWVVKQIDNQTSKVNDKTDLNYTRHSELGNEIRKTNNMMKESIKELEKIVYKQKNKVNEFERVIVELIDLLERPTNYQYQSAYLSELGDKIWVFYKTWDEYVTSKKDYKNDSNLKTLQKYLDALPSSNIDSDDAFFCIRKELTHPAIKDLQKIQKDYRFS